jgi:anti-anti-sigma regulatory factor
MGRARLEQTEFHKVFLARLDGSTLIVTPRGDAVGFRESDVVTELRTLLGLAGSPGVSHLVVDLGAANYFGTTMLDAINQLGTRFRDTGGQTAICDASPQMDEVLSIRQMNEGWMQFDTRKIALRAMSKV